MAKIALISRNSIKKAATKMEKFVSSWDTTRIESIKQQLNRLKWKVKAHHWADCPTTGPTIQ